MVIREEQDLLYLKFEYNPLIISEIRKLPYGMFDIQSKSWRIQKTDLFELIHRIHLFVDTKPLYAYL